STMSTEAELKKLTVPQLKVLCKEKRITGYSKLGKDAIIQKLLGTAVTPSGPSASAPDRDPSIQASSESQVSLTQAVPLPPNTTPHSSIPAESASKPRPKKRKNPPVSQESVATSTSTSVFKVPAVPQRESALAPVSASIPASTAAPKKKAVRTPSTENTVAHVAPPPPPASKPSSTFLLPRTTTTTAAVTNLPRRFVPLVVNAKKPRAHVPSVAPPPSSPTVPVVAEALVAETSYYLDFPTSPPPNSLSTITLPPSLSQRKRVPRFSLLLSCVADEDLKNCVLVSRMFRYAVYLSASHRLARNFAGKRLSTVLAKHPQAMTNMWPYLQQRTQELSTRKHKYNSSFLGRLFPSGLSNPISEHLWTSPDHEKQIHVDRVGCRFMLTRLFFQVSVGGGKDGKGWEEGQIVDAQQLAKDEVWMITVQHSATSSESFYVLESTCEPLTAIADSPAAGLPVRADWSAYIAHRTSAQAPAPRLLDCLSWTNHEEYQLGISRLWLKRIQSEGELGSVKRVTAERYILACVVGNRRVSPLVPFPFVLSGRWMSSTQMAQDFAGLADLAPAARVNVTPKVNLFLPAHHHIESVHFTAPRRMGMRVELHNALAVVQTPGREYFILRDNGMQVGCEEEGVAEVWMSILGCDNSGVAV
ncbi:hypothetical protein C8R44DRAFT_610238, partial [Mycena epipterygia]